MTRNTKTTFSMAAAAVARQDRVMAGLMKRIGPFHLPRTGRSHFFALAESIHYQQLAGAAAAAIHGRFIALFDGKPVPEAVLAMHPLGYSLAYGLRKIPSSKRLEALGERFRPYRTVAAWYCWRAVHEHRGKDG